jgi:signal transduction histidine kinase
MIRNNNNEIHFIVEIPESQDIQSGNLYFMIHIRRLDHLLAFLLDIRDYTYRMAEDLANSQRERLASIGQLSLGIAHEINNPNAFIRLNVGNLRTIMGALSALFEEFLVKEPDRRIGALPVNEVLDRIPRTLDAIENGSNRILKVITTLKDFGRPESQSYTVVNLNRVMAQAQDMTEYLSRDVANFKFTPLNGEPLVWGAQFELEQTLINFILNAWQSVREKKQQTPHYEGCITLRVTESADREKLTWVIEDNGMGNSKDTQARLFSPFFTTKVRGEGTGLGLSLAWKVIERHGGTIHVNSQDGEGAVFEIILPRYKPIEGESGV